jgi:hypothetical protein
MATRTRLHQLLGLLLGESAAAGVPHAVDGPPVRQIKRVEKVRRGGNWNVRDTAACVRRNQERGEWQKARRMEGERKGARVSRGAARCEPCGLPDI